MDEDQLKKIGKLVAQEAMNRFEACGAPDDFCISGIGMSSIGFGKENVVILDPRSRRHVVPDRSDPKFVLDWESLYGDATR